MKTMLSRFLWLIAITVSVAIGNQGCTENVSPLGEKDLQLVMEVENLPRSIVDLGYSKLNPQQRVLLWNRHLDAYVAKGNVSLELKQHITKLREIITVDHFKKFGTEESKQFNAKFTDSWFTQPVLGGTFTADQLLDLCSVFRLGQEITDKGARSADIGFPQKPKCNCNYNLGCARQCTSGGCGTGAANCGVFGSDTCTGHCT